MAVALSAIQDQQDRNALKRFARNIFLAGAALQSLLTLVNGTIYLFLDYHFRISRDYRGNDQNGFWEFLLSSLRIETMGAYAMGSIIFVFAAYLIGGIAPFGLIERNRPLIAVAARTMLLPSLLAGFGMVASFLLIRTMLENIFMRGGKELFGAFLPLAGLYFVPGLVTGTLAALLVRQYSIAQREQNGQAMRKDWALDLPSPI